MQEGVNLLRLALDLPEALPTFSFPCHRFFEIAVNV
jgi:hypothetical protein